MPKIRKKSLVRALGAVTASVATAAAAVVAGAPAWAGTATPTLATLGATVKVADPSLANVPAPGVLLRADACGTSTYATPTATVLAGEQIAKVSDGLTFRVPAAVPLAVNGAAKNYNVCVYQSATVGAQPITAANAPLTVYQPSSASPATGVSGVSTTISLSALSTLFSGLVTPAALFTTGTCPITYNASNGTAATVVKTGLANTSASVTAPAGLAAGTYSVCLYSGTGLTDTLLSVANYVSTLPQVTLSSASGPYDATNGITLGSGTTSLFSGVSAPGVLFTSTATCPAGYDASANTTFAVPASGIRKLAANRLAVTVPKLPLAANRQPATYQLCVYGGSAADSALLSAAQYVSTVLANPVSITPGAGPSTGGTTITVNGTDFPTGAGSISATLGGVPLLDVTPVNSTSFTATLPSRGATETAPLVVTTPAGTRALPGAFAFRDALKLLTNTAPNTTPTVDVAVQGSNFLSRPFGTGGNSSRIFLVRGEYNGIESSSGVRSNGPVSECENVLVISDTELVCTLRLNRRLGTDLLPLDPVGLVQSLTSDLGTIAGSRLVTSLGKVFTRNDIGQKIVQTTGTAAIPANTTIKQVLAPGLALLSAPATATVATIGADIGGIVNTIAGGLLTTNGSNVVSLATGTLGKADVGRVLNNVTGIPNGTTITSVAPNGLTATLSANATASTGGTLSITGTTGSSTNVTGTFTSADVGAIIGTNTLNIPPGTKIASQTGTAAVLSAAATATATSATSTPVERPVTLNLYPAVPVQEGAYNLTIVSNGAPNAATEDPDYQQTAVTSGSTFTVGAF